MGEALPSVSVAPQPRAPRLRLPRSRSSREGSASHECGARSPTREGLPRAREAPRSRAKRRVRRRKPLPRERRRARALECPSRGDEGAPPANARARPRTKGLRARRKRDAVGRACFAGVRGASAGRGRDPRLEDEACAWIARVRAWPEGLGTGQKRPAAGRAGFAGVRGASRSRALTPASAPRSETLWGRCVQRGGSVGLGASPRFTAMIAQSAPYASGLSSPRCPSTVSAFFKTGISSVA